MNKPEDEKYEKACAYLADFFRKNPLGQEAWITVRDHLRSSESRRVEAEKERDRLIETWNEDNAGVLAAKEAAEASLVEANKRVEAEHELFLTAHRDNMKGATLLAEAVRERDEAKRAADYDHDLVSRLQESIAALTSERDAIKTDPNRPTINTVTEAELKEQLAASDRAFNDECARHTAALSKIAALEEREKTLVEIIDSPKTKDFLEAVKIEVAHQKKRWGPDHDRQKTPDDWLWALAFLATKATQAARYGDTEKYLHHIVTSAALLANWHELALASLPAPEKEKEGA